MSLTSKERASLRAEAHHLKPLVQVGQHGLSDTVRRSLEDAFRTHELIKVALVKSELRAKEIAGDLAKEFGAEVIQVIGRTISLYRRIPDDASEA
jgi:RNA-binding protein